MPERQMISGGGDLGRTVYEQHCVSCHGVTGHGDGPASMLLSPRPTNFTLGVYEFRSTPTGSLPTDHDLVRTISNGLPGTAMPGWRKFITGDSLAALVAYVKRFSPRFANETPVPVHIATAVPPSAISIIAGRAVYERLQCAACHGTDGTGKNAVLMEFQNSAGQSMMSANLTLPWTFHGGATPEDIYLRCRTGLDGTSMSSFVGAATEKETWDLANYVVSLRRKPLWEMNAAEIQAISLQRDSASVSNPTRWGRTLVATLGCADCHTSLDPREGYFDWLNMAGGQKWSVGPWGFIYSANLTPDRETGLGDRTEAQLRQTLTRGIRHDGSRMLPFPMPWTAFAGLKDNDQHAIVVYLKSIPPVSNRIPQREPFGFFSYLKAKFGLLIMHDSFALRIYSGNAGAQDSTGRSMENTP